MFAIDPDKPCKEGGVIATNGPTEKCRACPVQVQTNENCPHLFEAWARRERGAANVERLLAWLHP